MIKLKRSNSFQYFFFTYICKFFLEIGHVSFIVTVRNVCINKFIHKKEKLFTAYIFSTWNIKPVELCIHHFFQLANFKCFPAMANRNANTAFTGTCCTPRPVGVYFNIIRQFKIDNMRNAFYIYSSCGNIGCN